MIKFFESNKEKCTIRIVVDTAGPCKIRVRVADAKNPNSSVYTDRWQVVNRRAIFRVRMPQSPEKCVIHVYNVNNGNVPAGSDKTFRISNLGFCK